MTAFSDEWQLHLQYLTQCLQRIRECGHTLNLGKCSFAQCEVKFCGQLIGLCIRRPDLTKVAAVEEMKIPETKNEVPKMLGFFSWFRDYIPDYVTHAKPLTDLTIKRVPAKIPWGQIQQQAFEKLKELLCKATVSPFHIIDFSKLYNLHVDGDDSDFAVGSVLSQTDETGNEKPIAFASKS